MPYLKLKEGQMYYEEYGQGPETIVAVHGNISTLAWWQFLVPFVRDNYRMIAMDLRGCGKTTHTADGYTIKQFVMDIDALVKQLNMTKFHLLGHSMGGQIAMAYTLAHQEKVQTLTLVDTVPADGLALDDVARAAFKEIQSNSQSLRQAVLSCFLNFNNKEVLEEIYQEAVKCAPEIYLSNPETMHETVLLGELSKITVPTLLMHGREDWVIPYPTIVNTMMALPKARIVLLEHCGHSPFLEKPASAAQEFLNFIRERSR